MDSTIVGSLNNNINMDSTIAGSLNNNINMDSTNAGSLNNNINIDSTIAGSINACNVCFMSWLTHRGWQWRSVRNESLRQKNAFNFVHCESFIWSNIQTALAFGVYNFFVSVSWDYVQDLWCILWFPNKEATAAELRLISWRHHFERLTVANMTITEYLCHIRIHNIQYIFRCYSHNPVLSVFMSFPRILSDSNRTGSTGGTGTFYLLCSLLF